jgi:HEPN domain-containing protein
MSDRSKDWQAQAWRDLEHARNDVTCGYFEHACFGAQQAAEKAVKAAYQKLHSEGWGHRVSTLLQELAAMSHPVPRTLVDDAKILDQYYVPTRYPNGFESGAPMDFYTEEQAADAVRRAEGIIRWCESLPGHQP